MGTSQAQAGQGARDEVATAADGQDEEGAPGSNPDGRSDDAEGGGSDSPEQAGLADVPDQVEREEADEDLGERVFHYDEWDHKIEDYRPAWCTLTEHRQTAPRRASSRRPSTSSAGSSPRSGATSS